MMSNFRAKNSHATLNYPVYSEKRTRFFSSVHDAKNASGHGHDIFFVYVSREATIMHETPSCFGDIGAW